jgi:putative membrane protein
VISVESIDGAEEVNDLHALIPILASAGGPHHGHWWIVFPILWTLVLVTLIAFVCRRRRGDGTGGDSARRILGERFARGEINVDEYRERLGQLQ